jgi:dienelactone hydrolase
VAFLYVRQGSPAALRARAGTLATVERTPLPGDREFAYDDLVLRGSGGLVVNARVRAIANAPRPRAAAVLLGGLNRGRRVINVRGLDAIAREVVLVSADYNIDAHRRAWRGAEALRSGLQIRAAALDAVAGVPLLLDYLVSRSDVRPDALFLVGSSLGAPTVAIAGALDTRPRAVIVLYGGGDLPSLLTHTLGYDDPPMPPWQAWLVGHALAWWIAPLEPARFAAGISPRALLMVNGARDGLIPRANVAALFDAAREPKELRWMDGDHIQPDEDALIERVSVIILDWVRGRKLLD